MLDYDTRRLIGSPQSERGLMFGRRRSLQCRCNWLRCNRQLSSQRSIPIGLLAVVLSLALDAKEPCIRFYIFLSLRCHRHCFFCIEEILGHRANETFVFLTLALFFLLFSFCLHTFQLFSTELVIRILKVLYKRAVLNCVSVDNDWLRIGYA